MEATEIFTNKIRKLWGNADYSSKHIDSLSDRHPEYVIRIDDGDTIEVGSW